jgi:phenylacetate-CoA ligase
VDEGYKPVPPGVSGRVLATPLHNFAMALIRYEIGDAATFAAAPCPCGRTLPLLASFDGRTPQRIRFPDGATAWPLLDFSSILDPARIHRHQLVYDGAWGIELRYAAASELSAKERAEAHAALKDRLHPDIEVTFAFRPDLAQVRARKFRTFLRKSDE